MNKPREWEIASEEMECQVIGPSTDGDKVRVVEYSALEAERKRSAKLVAALEYYADYMNYSIDYDTSNMGFSRRCILYGDIEERNEATGLAGLRARQALADFRASGEG